MDIGGIIIIGIGIVAPLLDNKKKEFIDIDNEKNCSPKEVAPGSNVNSQSENDRVGAVLIAIVIFFFLFIIAVEIIHNV